MAQKAESEKPDVKLSKRRFTLLIFLLIAIIILLSVIIILLMTFTMSNNKNLSTNETYKISNNYNDTISLDEQPSIPDYTHQLIYRDKWGGRPPLFERPQQVPVKYVIISHTAGAECFDISACSKQLQQIQKMHVAAGSPDVGYNFLIGGDANIYVARGWDNHNFHMDLDTIGICFIGNYVHHLLTPEMIEATQQLLNAGMKDGKLDKDYILVAHNQTYSTVSPGDNIYKQIKFWPHFSPDILLDIHK